MSFYAIYYSGSRELFIYSSFSLAGIIIGNDITRTYGLLPSNFTTNATFHFGGIPSMQNIGPDYIASAAFYPYKTGINLYATWTQ